MNLILATIIITGMAPDSLGCPASSLAQEPQLWYASVVREFVNQTIGEILPGQPFSFNFQVSNVDTFSVRVWGENSAGFGCETVVLATSTETTSVPHKLKEVKGWFDINGRRLRQEPKVSGIYIHDGKVIRIQR